MRGKSLLWTVSTLSALILVCSLPGLVWAKWYILTGAHPNSVYVIDAETDTVVKTIPLEGSGPIFTVAPNPARPQFAYAVTNLSQSVALVDLDEGKEVLRFNLSNDNELVRTMAIDVNPQGNRLYIHEMPLKKDLGKYEILETRIRVIDLDTNTVANVFPAPRQVMALASSQDGKKLYAFSVGKDISVLNPETGQVEDIIPMADWNVTGAGKLEGLPLWNPYQENDYLASFAVYMTDTITQHATVGVATLDLKQDNPDLQVVELQPYEAEWWTAHGAVSAKTQKAYLGWDKLWKMDIPTRQMEEVTQFDTNSVFGSFIHPDGTKVYCGGNWSALSVFDADTLKLLKKIDLGHSQAGAGIRFVNRENGF